MGKSFKNDWMRQMILVLGKDNRMLPDGLFYPLKIGSDIGV